MLQLTSYSCLTVHTSLSLTVWLLYALGTSLICPKYPTIDAQIESILPGSAGKATAKNKVHWLNTFMRISITINPTQYDQILENLFGGIAAISVGFVRRIRCTNCTWGPFTLNLYVNN